MNSPLETFRSGLFDVYTLRRCRENIWQPAFAEYVVRARSRERGVTGRHHVVREHPHCDARSDEGEVARPWRVSRPWVAL